MTTNQLRFAELRETQRTNRVNEGIKSDANVENKRHNEEQERINWFGNRANYETGLIRANAAASSAAAQHRQAGVAEALIPAQFTNAYANERNADTRVRELEETSSHNTETESQGRRNLDLKAKENSIKQQDADTRLFEHQSNNIMRDWQIKTDAYDRITGAFNNVFGLYGNATRGPKFTPKGTKPHAN